MHGRCLTLLLLIVYAWKMYDMQTLHGGGIPMFRGTYLVLYCRLKKLKQTRQYYDRWSSKVYNLLVCSPVPMADDRGSGGPKWLCNGHHRTSQVQPAHHQG